MVNTYKLKLTLLQQEILRFLYIKAGDSFNARTLAKKLQVSQPAISKSLPLLEKNDLIIVKKDKESKRFSIELNRDNPKVIGLKRVENIKFLYESGLIEFLYDTLPGATVIVFGSYSLGEDTTTSDIDLAIIGMKEKDLDLRKFEEVLDKEVVPNFYKSFKDIHKNLLNNILNGIILKGSVSL